MRAKVFIGREGGDWFEGTLLWPSGEGIRLQGLGIQALCMRRGMREVLVAAGQCGGARRGANGMCGMARRRRGEELGKGLGFRSTAGPGAEITSAPPCHYGMTMGNNKEKRGPKGPMEWTFTTATKEASDVAKCIVSWTCLCPRHTNQQCLGCCGATCRGSSGLSNQQLHVLPAHAGLPSREAHATGDGCLCCYARLSCNELQGVGKRGCRENTCLVVYTGAW